MSACTIKNRFVSNLDERVTNNISQSKHSSNWKQHRWCFRAQFSEKRMYSVENSLSPTINKLCEKKVHVVFVGIWKAHRLNRIAFKFKQILCTQNVYQTFCYATALLRFTHTQNWSKNTNKSVVFIVLVATKIKTEITELLCCILSCIVYQFEFRFKTIGPFCSVNWSWRTARHRQARAREPTTTKSVIFVIRISWELKRDHFHHYKHCTRRLLEFVLVEQCCCCCFAFIELCKYAYDENKSWQTVFMGFNKFNSATINAKRKTKANAVENNAIGTNWL